MKKTYIMKGVGVMAMLLLPLCEAKAAHLTPDQALRRVTGNATVKRMPAKSGYELSYIEKSVGEEMLYVFNRGENGFVVTSADDRLPALLGYSDEGAFDEKRIAPQLRWWLSQYAEEAQYFLNNSDKYTPRATTRSERAEVPTLLTTKWNQDVPYNLDCPEDGGGRCVTGCVATAMAQVIKYHGYPVTGSGQHSYSWYGRELSFDYGAATFDYAEMLDEYNPYEDTATEAQKRAVAKLMYACGVSVNMDYSSDMSGANDIFVVKALREYFNYGNGVRFLSRNNYTFQDWEEIVYAEVQAGRPVIYGGQAPDGGHEFVCDGYKDGFFHINWGWGGYCNGYFPLNGLDPQFEGIGGFAGGYNSNQTLICGISPDSSSAAPEYNICATGGISVTQVQFNQYVTITIQKGMIGNYGIEPLNVDFKLKAVSESGEEYVSSTATQLQLPSVNEDGSLSGYTGFGLYLPENLSEGLYKLYLGFEDAEGNWQDVIFPVTVASYLNMTVDGDGNVSFTAGTPIEKATIEVVDFAPRSIVNKGEECVFDFTIRNTGYSEYSGSIDIRVYAHGENEVLKNNMFNISLGAQAEGNYSVPLTYDLEDGEYDAVFYDMYGDKVSEIFSLRIGRAPVTVTGITLNQTEATMIVDETLQLSATVHPEDADDKAITWSSSNPEIANVDENGLVTAFNVGNVVITAKSVVSEDISASCEITVKAKVIEVEGIALSRTEATLTEGETLELTAVLEPESATDKSVVWKSSDESVATVEDGLVTAIAAGTATITAETVNGLTASCEITVKAKVIEVEGIALSQTEATLTEGETIELTAVLEPESATDKSVVWKSSDESVATVVDGLVTAVAAGTAIITAETSNGLTASCEITVKAKEPEIVLATSITLDKEAIEAIVGSEVKLIATVLPDDATDKTVEWSSSDEAIATVDSEGNVKILEIGSAVITAATTDGSDLKATCMISGLSGIEAIVSEAGGADIYNINGIIVKKGADAVFLSTLAKGTYIIVVNGKTYKIVK